MLDKSAISLAVLTLTATACATDDPVDDPATGSTAQAVVGCDMLDSPFGDFDLGPVAIEELGGSIDTLGFGDTWNTGCDLGGGTVGGDFGGGGGFCPSQTRQGIGEGISEAGEDGARAMARAEAHANARSQCVSYFYYPAFPSYCEGGYDTAFSITDSCFRPYPDLYPSYWRCSARATVTCSGYTWHAW